MIFLYACIAFGLLITNIEQKKIGWNSIEKEGFGPNGNLVSPRHPVTHLKKLDVVCAKDHMTVHIEFDEPFYGLVYSQPGKHHHQRCIHVGPHSGILHTSFHIAYDSCGTTEDLRGQFHENTIILQYGEDVLEAWDEAKRLRCEWLETYEKPSSDQSVKIADLDVVELNFRGDDIECWMEIQEGKGPWAREVTGLVTLGSPLTIVIAINDHTKQFDMKVKECRAHDDGGSVVNLIDENGCVLRSTLLTPFVKVRDFSNKASLIAYSHLFAFKFPDQLDVYVSCVVEICRHGCSEPCHGNSISELSPSPRRPPHGHTKNHAPVFQAIPFHLLHIQNQPQPGRQKEPLPVYADTGPKSKITDPPPDFGHNKQSAADFELLKMLNRLKHTENSLKKHKIDALAAFAANPHLPATHKADFGPAPPEQQPEPNSFAHPHHITTEELQKIQNAREPQPEPNSFDHPHHITTEELLRLQQGQADPQPEPNSFAHPHHITTEELLNRQKSAQVPQPEPNSFAHPHHITTEELLRLQQGNAEPQPEPNSFAHPHHLTTEQILQAQRNKETVEHQQLYQHAHHVQEPQPEPNSFAHPHHITTEQLRKQQQQNANPHSNAHFVLHEAFESTRVETVQNKFTKNKHKIAIGSAALPSVISVTLSPNGTPVLRYSPTPGSTPPQPAYIPGRHVGNNSSVHHPMWHNHPNPIGPDGIPYLQRFPIVTFKPKQRHPYPVPQFSPRQQVMMSVIADRRMDEDVDEQQDEAQHHHHPEQQSKKQQPDALDANTRPPVSGFLLQTNLDGLESSARSSQGPRKLRVKRSDQVIGVQQKFRAVALADLAFELNETVDGAAIYRGRREEIIYGVCLSTAKLSISFGLILFLTLCSTIIATVLFHRSQILLRQRGVEKTSTFAVLFGGQFERLYKPSHSNRPNTDIMELG